MSVIQNDELVFPSLDYHASTGPNQANVTSRTSAIMAAIIAIPAPITAIIGMPGGALLLH